LTVGGRSRGVALSCAAAVACQPTAGDAPPIHDSVEALGEALFFDTSLSRNRTQACSTCHDPAHAFTDGRRDPAGRVAATSLGDDGRSWGRRNAPSVAYAMFSPEFHYGSRTRHNKQQANRVYEGALGGQLLDGRAEGLETQAGGPPLDLTEMGMPDRAAVVGRILEQGDYVAAFETHFGDDVFDDDDRAYEAMTHSIAAYERTSVFATFDSRYDRSLRGEIALTFAELTGKAVFFSQFANCSICHQFHSEGDPVNEIREPFTGYEYHNIGVPVNVVLQQLTGVDDADPGLVNNALVTDPAERGKFKVPTLRNVAVTGPYMHNGVFADLRTVIAFYDHFNNPEVRAVDPESGEPWEPPEVAESVALDLLEVGDPRNSTGWFAFSER
jgi:cytochrome c peroxidase